MNRSLSLALLLFFGAAPAALGQDAWAARDAVILDPDHHHVILENDHVRILEVLAAPGDTSPMHTHPPLVLVSLDHARIRMHVPDGSSSTVALSPGTVLWLENVEHSWKLLSGQIHVFAVEIKAARGGRALAPLVPREREAVVLVPAHHKVVLENDHVRVFEAVETVLGNESPMQPHPPTAVINLDTGCLRIHRSDGLASIYDLNPAEALWIEKGEYSWVICSGTWHAFGVEVKAAR